MEQEILAYRMSSNSITLRGQNFAWEGNIKMELKRLEWECVNWICVVEDWIGGGLL